MANMANRQMRMEQWERNLHMPWHWCGSSVYVIAYLPKVRRHDVLFYEIVCIMSRDTVVVGVLIASALVHNSLSSNTFNALGKGMMFLAEGLGTIDNGIFFVPLVRDFIQKMQNDDVGCDCVQSKAIY